MNVDKKVKELLRKPYKMDYWDYRNDEPNSDDWMLEQAIENSLIVVEEIIKSSPSLPILGEGGYLYEDIELSTKFWQEVENKLKTMLDEFK